MFGIPVKEQLDSMTPEQKAERYYSLVDLSEFMKSFFEASAKAEQIFSNKVTLAKISKKVSEMPLEYSSDEDLVYDASALEHQ